MNNNNSLVTSQQIPTIPVGEVERMAIAVAKSGLFGIKTPEAAMSLMLISMAEGRHPALAARDYDIIQGKPAKKAEAMLRDFLQSGGSVEWHHLSDEIAEATFSHPQGGKVRIAWDMARAKTAGLASRDMFKKFPRQMLRSRTVSEGIRTVCPMATSGMYVPEEVSEFENTKQIKVEKPVIKVEEPEVINAEIVEETELQNTTEFPKDLPDSPITMLGSMMWSDEIPDAHVIHFLIAKKMPNVTKSTTLSELDTKVIERLIAKWDDVKAFKPIL
jgi:hypothetical protein